mmetsp:Transcript_52156/g.129931  ORF Transcript_52156/g.129931 Transcript_52156/m.129931 type:complete len:280 (-) Transcript_52156:503-1342(-)
MPKPCLRVLGTAFHPALPAPRERRNNQPGANGGIRKLLHASWVREVAILQDWNDDGRLFNGTQRLNVARLGDTRRDAAPHQQASALAEDVCEGVREGFVPLFVWQVRDVDLWGHDARQLDSGKASSGLALGTRDALAESAALFKHVKPCRRPREAVGRVGAILDALWAGNAGACLLVAQPPLLHHHSDPIAQLLLPPLLPQVDASPLRLGIGGPRPPRALCWVEGGMLQHADDVAATLFKLAQALEGKLVLAEGCIKHSNRHPGKTLKDVAVRHFEGGQ